MILTLSFPVCTAYAFRAESKGANTLNNNVAGSASKMRGPARKPNKKQLEAARKGVKSGCSIVWHPRLGTPSLIRGKNLGQKQDFSGGKGLSLKGGGAYESDAVAVMDNLSTIFNINDAEKEVSVDRVDSDSLGFHHVKIKQAYKGLRVFGADLIVHFNEKDLAYEVNGQYVPDINVDVVPAISSDRAVKIARTELRKAKLPAGKLEKEPELVIYAFNSEPVLAYEFKLVYDDGATEPGRWCFWISAVNGEILLNYNDVEHVDPPSAAGTPASVSGNVLDGEGGNDATIQGWFENSIYYLFNADLKLTIHNAASAGYTDANDFAHRSTDDWGSSDPVEMSCANNLAYTLRYYADYHGRASYDGLGSPVPGYAHYGDHFVNAFWDGTAMRFGDGDGVTADPLAVLDICAHEYTHAVTEYSAHLIYAYESGALNESFSDIFGTCVEFKYQPDGRDAYPNSIPGHADWLMGEDCWLASTALRDLRNPSNPLTVGTADPYNLLPSRYMGTHWYTGGDDYGGVHHNMGVQSFFFYLLCEGGSGNNDGIDYNFEGIGITNAEQILYRTLTVYCTPSTDYHAVRGAWMSAAKDFSPEWLQVVRDAWDACGISGPPLVQLSASGALPDGREWADYSYSIGVFSEDEETNHFWFVTSGSLPDGLSLGEKSGIISGIPTQETNAVFDVAVTNTYQEAVTNSYSLRILPVHVIPFEENFDSDSVGLPDFWTQEFVQSSQSWTIQQSLNDVYPERAYSLTNFITLYKADVNDNVTRLVTPRIDFGEGARAGRISFYHYMQRWLNQTDELHVYYKLAREDEWVLLASYTSSITDWTERVIDLPEISRSVYIAFEGTARYGHGVCIDSVKVWDPTPPYRFVTPDPLPNAVIDEPYQKNLVVEGGYPPYEFEVAYNELPPGLTLSPEGTISGVATENMHVDVGIQVMDAVGTILVKEYSLTVTEPPVNLFEENFEHGGKMPPPDSNGNVWTQEFVTYGTQWTMEMGGYNSHPIAAQEGGFNARFFAADRDPDTGEYRTHVTRLVSPRIILGQAPENITLYFWQCMEEYGGDLDGLRVLYKTSHDGEWIEIGEFNENTPQWTERSLHLPDPTDDYYIAFEGIARFGYGVCIDNISITDESLAPVITTDHKLPDGQVNVEYEFQMEAVGGVQPYDWNLVGGTLPDGMTFSNDGLLSGTPQTTYLGDLQIEVVGSDGQSSTNGFSLNIRSVQGIPFFEDFEHGGDMPYGWTQSYRSGSVNWVMTTGTACTSLTRVPTSAYSGSYNASFYFNSRMPPTMTRLVTPMLDLGAGVTNVVLTFRHFMAEWNGDQDSLSVYYRNTTDGEWVLLESYEENTPNWTEHVIDLPNLSSTYYVAFEGHAKYGYGVNIDDVSINGDKTDPYSNWLEDYFTVGEIGDGLMTGYFDDPDGDKILNIWEYAYFLNPRVFNTSGTPTGGVSNAYLQLMYRQNKAAFDLTFEVESTTNLVTGSWTTNAVSEILRTDMGDWWDVTAQHDVPVTNAPSRFMRLKLLTD